MYHIQQSIHASHCFPCFSYFPYYDFFLSTQLERTTVGTVLGAERCVHAMVVRHRRHHLPHVRLPRTEGGSAGGVGRVQLQNHRHQREAGRYEGARTLFNQ